MLLAVMILLLLFVSPLCLVFVVLVDVFAVAVVAIIFMLGLDVMFVLVVHAVDDDSDFFFLNVAFNML